MIKNRNNFFLNTKIRLIISLLFFLLLCLVISLFVNFKPNSITFNLSSPKQEIKYDIDSHNIKVDKQIHINFGKDLSSSIIDFNPDTDVISDFFWLDKISIKNNELKETWVCSEFSYIVSPADKFIVVRIKPADFKSAIEISAINLFLDGTELMLSHKEGLQYYFKINTDIRDFSEVKMIYSSIITDEQRGLILASGTTTREDNDEITIRELHKDKSIIGINLDSLKVMPESPLRISSISLNKEIRKFNLKFSLYKFWASEIEKKFGISGDIDEFSLRENGVYVDFSGINPSIKSLFDYSGMVNRIDFKFKIISYLIALILSIYLFFTINYIIRFRINKDVIDFIDNEPANERLNKEEMRREFSNKFPRLARLPVLNNIFSGIYGEGWKHILVLFLILTLFTAIKAPYLGMPFAGNNVAVKYNAYVEPAKYMAERNDPFWYQKKYNSDPVGNPLGILRYFSNLPVIEWGLFLMYKLFPFLLLEFATRLFMHIIGILILISAYIFFKFYFSKIHSLIIIYLMAINPFISFSTFITVYDSLCIFFMFVSLIMLNMYFSDREFKFILLAGLFFGIGNACKISLFLWFAPLVFVLMIHKKENIEIFLRDYLLFILISFLPVITVFTSIRLLPSFHYLGMILLLIWISAYIVLFLLLIKIEDTISRLIKFVFNHKFFLFLSLILFVMLTVVFLLFTKYYRLIGHFLTDYRLLFNPRVYFYTLIHKFNFGMTENVLIIGMIGIVLIFFFKNKNLFVISLSFLAGSVFYWIIAIKSVIIHDYYSIIIMITFCLLASTVFYYLYRIMKKIYLKIILLFFLLLLIKNGYTYTVAELSAKFNGIKEASVYLEENTKTDDIYIPFNNVYSLTIYTGRPCIYNFNNFIENEVIKDLIARTGLAGTMAKYNVKYAIIAGMNISYYKFANLFTHEKLQSPDFRRADEILSRVEEDYDYFRDIEKRKEIINDFNVRQKIILEKKIGDYRFYRFED